MSVDIKNLPNDSEALKKLLLNLHSESQGWKLKYESLLETFKLAQQHRYGASSEKNILQDDFFDEADAPIPEDNTSEEEVIVQAHARKKHPKRPKLPEHLPREVIEYDISDEEKQCACGCQKERFGEEVSEQLDVIPPQLKVLKHVRPKYVCKRCEANISVAPMPDLLLPKSIAAPGLVAYTITAKYVDHLPLYRQEAIWKRYGIAIPRNSSCGWLMKTYELCEPLWLLLGNYVFSWKYVQADETPGQVLKEPGRKDRQKSYIWVYRGGLPNKKAVYFEYQETREAKHAQRLLKGFKGYLQTDGYRGYDWVDKEPDITHLACMAHARRPFAELVKISKKTGKAHEALSLIGKLYAIEDEARDNQLTAKERYDLRLEQSVPILDKIRAWLDRCIEGTPPKGKLGRGIRYMLDRWEELTHYLKDGNLEIDNNLIENDIRPFALGKKNWLFAGNPRGAKAGAVFYSLIKTAQANGIEPYAYLRYILERIRGCKVESDYEMLLPWNISVDQLK